MKKLFLFVLFLAFGTASFAQTKNDSLKRWSVGFNASVNRYMYPHFPGYPDNGLPYLNSVGALSSSRIGGCLTNSIGTDFSYRFHKRYCIQLTITKTTVHDGGYSLSTNGGYAHYFNGLHIWSNKLKYLETPISFIFYYKIKKKRNAYCSLGLVPSFLYFENVSESSTDHPQGITLENYDFRLNRIFPDISIGCDYFLSKNLSIFWKCNFDFRPFYIKNNTFIKETYIQFRINTGFNFHF